jgi:Fe(3+) dicitrate transport protein
MSLTRTTQAARKGCAMFLGLSIAAAAPALAEEAPLPPGPSDEVVVIGQRQDLLRIPGSGAVIDAEDLERARVLTVNEALRQAPGLFPRDEEGLGLRPNIGVRGLSPTRSTKVLLLEDGLPLGYAPYGDNASYSHPPVRRFDRIEVLKGASQVRFGPQTIGGVINYITPAAPDNAKGRVTLAGGSDGYREIDASGGGAVAGIRLLAHLNATRSDGVRANTALAVDDYYLKAERDFAAHAVTARLGLYEEDSQVTYSGLTSSEFAANPRANPFRNDEFVTERATASITHGWKIGETATLTTSAYTLWFDRDWWRQSSNSGQRPNDASDPLCAGMANLDTTCGNEGRLREYNVYGLESRLRWSGRLAGGALDLETGLRAHTERQRRLQINGDSPRARTPGVGRNAGVREDDLRSVEAYSGFATATLDYGRFAISPGVRLEDIRYERANRLARTAGETSLSEIVPGLGATFDATPTLVLFAGVHRGFAPPTVADIVTGAGGAVDLDPEESTNWELGLRGDVRDGLFIDLAAFLLEFDNQIVPASVAGGVGAALTSAGETRHAGAEASLRFSSTDMGLTDGFDVFGRTALTYVGSADYRGRRFSSVAGFSGVRVDGNRLPYAPEWLASAALGVARGDWLTAQLEVQYTGEMFADDLNTIAPSPDGQRGLIEAATVWNAAATVRPGGGSTAFFVTVKNIADTLYIVDRSRGILPGGPRTVQAGLSLSF